MRVRIRTIVPSALLTLAPFVGSGVAGCVITLGIVLTSGVASKLGLPNRSGEGPAAGPVCGAVAALVAPILGSLVFLWSLAIEWPFLWSLAAWLGIIASGQAWAAIATAWERKHKGASAAPVPRMS